MHLSGTEFVVMKNTDTTLSSTSEEKMLSHEGGKMDR